MQSTSKIQLNVFAAASLKNAFEQIGRNFEASYPDIQVVFNFAGSQQLAQQIIAGAPADVFASASMRDMQAVLDYNYSSQELVSIFAFNNMVIVAPTSNPGKINDLADLARPGLRLILAAPEVPAGLYAQEILKNAQKSQYYGSEFPVLVKANVVSFEENVRAVLTKVILGEADAGIVYGSDAQSAADEVNAIQIPDELNITAQYPISLVSKTTYPEIARAFITYVLSDAGQDILRMAGFSSGVFKK